MPRIRTVTTQVWSQAHLIRALADLGYREPEVHVQPEALRSWRGVPLGPLATIIVRREAIGSAGDDLGFARNEHGTFDAIISEIHFFRFDRRWIADLERRHAELAEADGLMPPASVRLGDAALDKVGTENTTARVRDELVTARATESAGRDARLARAEALTRLDSLRKEQARFGKVGCLAGLMLPLVIWFVLAGLVPDLRDGRGFLMVAGPLWLIVIVILSTLAAGRVTRAARQLAKEIPSSKEARAAAQSALEAKLKPAGAKVEDATVRSLLKALRELRG